MLGMLVVVSLYLVLGLLGYLVYGKDVCPSITFNLTSDNLLTNT